MALFQRMTMGTSSSDMGNDTMVMMGPFSTQVGNSILWFPNWIPTTAPATFGACVGLFFLAGASRFVEALRVACSPPLTSTRRFLLGPECVCATLFMLLSGVNYFLMLAVMQFDVWFFIAILLGLWAGSWVLGGTARRMDRY